MSKLVDVYEQLCLMLNLEVNEHKHVFIKTKEGVTPLMINKLPAVLPTDENIREMTQLQNGVPTKVYEIFNPMQEDPIKKSNASLDRLNHFMEMKLLGVVYQIGHEVFTKMANKDTEINDVAFMKYSALLSRMKTTSKQLVDDNTIKNWFKVFDNLTLKYINKKYISLYLKRGGKVDGITCNRSGAISYPLGELILDLTNKNNELLDVKLRPKDIHAFKSLFEMIAGNEQKVRDGFVVGSINKVAPGCHTLLQMYDKVYKQLEGIIEATKKDADDVNSAKLDLKPLPWDIAMVTEIITDLDSEIRKVPSETQTPVIRNETTGPTLVKTTTPTTGTGVPTNTVGEKSTASGWAKFNVDNVNPMVGNVQQPQTGFNMNVNNNVNPIGFGQPVQTGFNMNVNNNVNPIGMERPVMTNSFNPINNNRPW